ncbi:MAG: hypothetical protein JW885_15160 [Deltaproteobacteria bacterium]|nr:hypothetical protein [Candidatus Zymogenaceae bacterium]
MKRFMICILMVCALVIPAAIATAQDSIEPTPIPVDPSKVDFTGVWTYTVTPMSIVGMCPPGVPGSGELSIAVAGDVVTLTFLSGRTCAPPSMCIFTGRVEEGQIMVSNTDIVDDEGGEATNAMALFFSSDSNGWGRGSSRYLHPSGFECVWEDNITISR